MGKFSPLARRLVGGLAFCAWLSSVQALEVVVEGRALVREGDLPQARQLAMRRALASAAESRAATVSIRSIAHPDAVLETAQVSASACTREAQVLNEAVTHWAHRAHRRLVLRAIGFTHGCCRDDRIYY